MYYEILKYFNDYQNLSSLIDKIIDYNEKYNKNLNIDKIEDLLIKFYLKNKDKHYKKQELSNISNYICKKIIF